MKHPNLFGALLAAVFPFLLGAPASAQLLQDISPVPGGDWQITWKSEAGVDYTVQRSADLENWFDLETVTATASETTFVDNTAPAAQQFFWRLRYDDDGPVLLAPFSIIEVVKVDSEGTPVSPNTPGAHWRITWESQPGALYTLQRAPDGLTWTPVATVTATAETTSYIDREAPDVPLMLWRVLGMSGGGGGLQISEIQPQFSSSGGSNAASLGVVIDSDVPIQSVVFRDGDTELGEALAGPGGSWSFPIQWDPDAPRIVQLSVQVNPVEGEPVNSDPLGLLLADPTRFVPVGTDGSLGYGQFVPVNEDGTLGAFHYYPEGTGDLREHTGAHFRIEAGAELIQQPDDTFVLQLTAAHFHRGRGDEAPLPSEPGTQELPLDQITAATVEAAFETNDEPLKLRWGSTEVCWTGGVLGEDGWNSLFVKPLIGSFELPGLTVRAEIGADLENNRFYLLTCFHGAWNAATGIGLEIPEASPLKIYLGTDGSISAYGTVEATFPDGAKLRGTASWREPNFEFSFEGRGFTIPALEALAPSLAASDPTSLVPTGTEQAELDHATEQLRALQRSYTKLAGASLQQAAFGADASGALSPSPIPEAGATLTAWADWITVNGGSGLTGPDTDKLRDALEKSGKTAEASHSLLTALTIMRDARNIKEANVAALGELPATTETRAAAAADRLIRESSLPSDSGTKSAIASLLLDTTPEPAPAHAPRKDGTGGDEDTARISRYIEQQWPPRYFETLEIRADDTNGLDNPALQRLGFHRLISIFDEMLELHALLPRSTLNPINYPIRETVLQVSGRLKDRNHAEAQDAIATLLFNSFRRVLDERVVFMDRARAAIGLLDAIPEDLADFQSPNTTTLIEEYRAAFTTYLATLPPPQGAELYSAEVDRWLQVSQSFNLPGLEAVIRTDWAPLLAANSARAAVGTSALCTRLASELIVYGRSELVDLPDIDPITEGFDFTGGYEANDLVLPLEPPSEPDQTGGFRGADTMHVVQSERFISGWLYLRRYVSTLVPGTGFVDSIEVDQIQFQGLLADKQPAGLKFAVQFLNNGIAVNYGTLTFTAGGNSVDLAIKFNEAFTVYAYAERFFSLVTPSAPMPEPIFQALDAATQARLQGTQRRSLHTVERESLANSIDAVMDQVETLKLDAIVDVDAIASSFAQSYWTFPRRMRSAFVDRFSHVLAHSDMTVTIKDKDGTITLTRSYTEWLNFIHEKSGDKLNFLDEILGLAEPQYTYDIWLSGVGSGAAAVLINGGVRGILITVKKTKNSSGEPPTFYLLEGGLVNVGGGIALPGVSPHATVSVGSFSSPNDYGAEKFEGVVFLRSFGGRAFVAELSYSALDFVKIKESADMSGLAISLELGGAVGVDLGIGHVRLPAADPGSLLPQFTSPLVHSSTTDAQLNSAIHFRSSSSILSPCGWQVLREFTATYRALFDDPTTCIEVVGYSSTDEGPDRQALALQRAETVRDGIQSLINMPPETVLFPFGLELHDVDEAALLPSIGRLTVIVGVLNTGLHIRILDVCGKIVVDKAESELMPGEPLSRLGQKLSPGNVPQLSDFTALERQEILDDAVEAAGFAPQFIRSGNVRGLAEPEQVGTDWHRADVILNGRIKLTLNAIAPAQGN